MFSFLIADNQNRYFATHKPQSKQGSYAILKINLKTFSKPFLHLTFPYDLPRSNTGSVKFNIK